MTTITIERELLERAALEVSRIDDETWFGNQLAFGIACRKAIRALKEQQ